MLMPNTVQSGSDPYSMILTDNSTSEVLRAIAEQEDEVWQAMAVTLTDEDFDHVTD